jgi:hypothetical protein
MDDDATRIATDALIRDLTDDLENCAAVASHRCRNRDDEVRFRAEISNLLKHATKHFDNSVDLVCCLNHLLCSGKFLATFVAVEVSLVAIVTSALNLRSIAKELCAPSAPLGIRVFLIANYFTLTPTEKNDVTEALRLSIKAASPQQALLEFVRKLPGSLDDVFAYSVPKPSDHECAAIATLLGHATQGCSEFALVNNTLCARGEVVARAFAVGNSLLVALDQVMCSAKQASIELDNKQIVDMTLSGALWHCYAVYNYFTLDHDTTSVHEMSKALFPPLRFPDIQQNKAAVINGIATLFLAANSINDAFGATTFSVNKIRQSNAEQVFDTIAAQSQGGLNRVGNRLQLVESLSDKFHMHTKPPEVAKCIPGDVAAIFAFETSLIMVTLRDVDAQRFVLGAQQADARLAAHVELVAHPALPHKLSCFVIYNYFLLTRKQAVVIPHLLYDAMFSLSDFLIMFGSLSRQLSIAKSNGTIQKLFMIVSTRDLGVLNGRHVPLPSSNTTSPRSICDFFLTCLDGSSMAQDSSSDSALLVGGESGAGKTDRMFTGQCGNVDVVVYLRFAEEFLSGDTGVVGKIDHRRVERNTETLLESTEKVTVADVRKLDEQVDKSARNKAFGALVRYSVERAMKESCPGLHQKLCRYTGTRKFRVRVCFDEIGYSPLFVKACCGLKPSGLRAALGWKETVDVEVLAAGTGVGTAASSGGSENSFWRMKILAPRRDFYWNARLHLIDRVAKGYPMKAELLHHVTTVKNRWDDPTERAAAMNARHAWLVSQVDANSQKMMIGLMQVLVLELVFAGVEADSACATAIENTRLAALIVVRCQLLAKEIVDSQICYTMSGANIRRQVLLPVALQFQQKNSLCHLDGEDVRMLFVAAHRYVLFEGYASSEFSAHDLIIRRGVLVDNLVYMPKVSNAYEKVRDAAGSAMTMGMHLPAEKEKGRVSGRSTLPSTAEVSSRLASALPPAPVTFFACYEKVIGRYSISPAMVFVLLLLMANSSQDKLGGTRDVFEHAIATFLFFAAQIFHERPVSELVAFFADPFAVLGANVVKVLDPSRRTIRMVRFKRIELRTSGSVNMHLVKNESDAGAAGPGTTQFNQLWDSQPSTAWIEVSPRNLPCADVVMHIPGAVTLAVSCEDRNPPLDAVLKALHVMQGYGDRQRMLRSRLATQTKTTVIPVMCLSRTWSSSAQTSRCPSSGAPLVDPSDFTVELLEAIGDDAMLVHGIAEPMLPIVFTGTSKRVAKSCDKIIRIHRVRYNLLQFDVRDAELTFSVIIAAADAPSETTRNERRQQQCAKYAKKTVTAFMMGCRPQPTAQPASRRNN